MQKQGAKVEKKADWGADYHLTCEKSNGEAWSEMMTVFESNPYSHVNDTARVNPKERDVLRLRKGQVGKKSV